MYTEQEFINDVKAEVKALKKHATKSELLMLADAQIDPNDLRSCIYGQMTGDCRSDRAKELIAACCVLSVDQSRPIKPISRSRALANIAPGELAASRKKGNPTCALDFTYIPEYLSALEAFILYNKRSIPKIVRYLTGQTKTLDL